MPMAIIKLIGDSGAPTVIFKSAQELRHDLQRLCSEFETKFKKIEANHADADAGVELGVLAKADQRLSPLEAQNAILKASIASTEHHTATLEKIRDLVNAQNIALDEHIALSERSRRFRQRHARWFA